MKGVRRDERYRKLPLKKQQHVAKTTFSTFQNPSFPSGEIPLSFFIPSFPPSKKGYLPHLASLQQIFF